MLQRLFASLLLLYHLFVSATCSPLLKDQTKAKTGHATFRLKHIVAHGTIPIALRTNNNTSRGAFFKRYDVKGDESWLLSQEEMGSARFVRGEVHEWSRISERKVGLRSGGDGGLRVQGETQQFPQQNPMSVPRKPIDLPDHKDPATVLTLARMTYNAYNEPTDKDWMDLPGWDQTDRFGWVGKGIRGYVFTDDHNEIMVIVLKGTTLATPIGGGPTSPEDKHNDNMMFSCCCGKAGWTWTPICDCPAPNNHCSERCLKRECNFDGSYYNLAQTIYLAVESWFPKAMSIWLAGHSLGGALASLVALTNDLPSFGYEAPGDLLYAKRIGLLPDLPPSGDPSVPPDWTDFLKTLPQWHFGNTGDPIFLGECNGPSSSCWWFNYALETRCHIGYECVYDENSYNKTSTASRTSDSSMSTLMTSVRYHSIGFVITTFLEKWVYVPQCNVAENCLAKECSQWTFTD